MSNITNSYAHPCFFDLAAQICMWGKDRFMGAAVPTPIFHPDIQRPFLLANFGEEPLCGGQCYVFTYDEMNDEYVCWHENQDGWDFYKSWQENVEILPGARVSSLGALAVYVCTNEIYPA